MNPKCLLPLLATTMAAAFATSVCAADICQGPPAVKGAVVHGPVLEIPDGSSLCIATGASASAWVKIPLSHLQTSRTALMAAAFGKNATCTVDSDGRGDCMIEGQTLVMALQGPELAKAASAGADDTGG
jgi:hypothetical protein